MPDADALSNTRQREQSLDMRHLKVELVCKNKLLLKNSLAFEKFSGTP